MLTARLRLAPAAAVGVDEGKDNAETCYRAVDRHPDGDRTASVDEPNRRRAPSPEPGKARWMRQQPIARWWHLLRWARTRTRCVVPVLFAALSLSATLVSAQDRSARIRDYLEQARVSSGTPGISAAVGLRDDIVFSDGVGYADLNHMVPATGLTVHNIGSISKANAAVAVMKLVEEGRLELDNEIRDYVPMFPRKRWPITLRHIMTHTSGIRHYRPDDFVDGRESMKRYTSVDQALTRFADDPLLFAPGTYYLYSSYGTNLLQAVIEWAGDLGFEAYTTRHVWLPAGMLRTAFDVPERIVRNRARGYRRVEDGELRHEPYGDMSYKYASGGMISTTEDLVRLGIALNNGTLLRQSTLREMYRKQVDVMGHVAEGRPVELDFEQGLIWYSWRDVAGRRVVGHSGSVRGFQAILINYPAQSVVVAIIGNARHFRPALHAMAIAQMFLGSGATP